MPRPIKFRNIYSKPEITYFKPRGIPLSLLKETTLNIDELEAIRLKNLEELEQTDCARKMKVSQSTFQRILSSAYKKIAKALIFGEAIKIEGGNVIIKNIKNKMKPYKIFKCEKCKYEWKEKFGTGKRGIDMSCPKCKLKFVHRIDHKGHGFGRQLWGYKFSKK